MFGAPGAAAAVTFALRRTLVELGSSLQALNAHCDSLIALVGGLKACYPSPVSICLFIS